MKGAKRRAWTRAKPTSTRCHQGVPPSPSPPVSIRGCKKWTDSGRILGWAQSDQGCAGPGGGGGLRIGVYPSDGYNMYIKTDAGPNQSVCVKVLTTNQQL